MYRILLLISLVVFAIVAINCTSSEPPPPPAKTPAAQPPPAKPKPKEQPPEVKFLMEKCGSEECHPAETMPALVETLKTMNLEQFKAALTNEEVHGDVELTEDEVQAVLDFFEKWKASMAEKEAKAAENAMAGETEKAPEGE